jgi:hypothetical protein
MITQSDNYMNIYSIAIQHAQHATENGFVKTQFLNTRPLLGTDINSSQTVELYGLPILGVSLQQFTNAGAAEGLLAQYGSAHKVKSSLRVVEPDQASSN